MSENIIPLNLEVSKECITTVNRQEITRYFVHNFDDGVELTLEHLEQIRDFFIAYVAHERRMLEQD